MVPKQMQDLRQDEDFLLDPLPTCVLDDKFVIRAVNNAYVTMTGCPEDELLSFELFEVFPENPAAPESDGHLQVRLSGEAVLREKRAHHLLLQRYDIPDRHEPGAFLPRYWVPVNRPFLIDDAVRGVVNQVSAVPEPEAQTMAALKAIRDAADGGFFLDEPADEERLQSFLAAIDQLNALGREVNQLREALVSRATIDQAKGLIMADRHCSPQEAFRVLVKLSNDTNVRVSEVARALVYQAQQTHRR